MNSHSHQNQRNASAITKYDERFIHFDITELPPILESHLQKNEQILADIGCGDGPWFNLLHEKGFFSSKTPVYAIDLDENRLKRIVSRFPWIQTYTGSAENIPELKDESVNFIISTMVMEHVFDETKYLAEMHRILKARGKAFITTVFKKKWAVFYRRRKGEFVLDTSHVREYTDLEQFKKLVENSRFKILELTLSPIKIPLFKPIFRIWKRKERSVDPIIKAMLIPQISVPGYYEIAMVVQKLS
jgi:ubiquinone/menaquinone biosynthesis C-methylase UbiE